MTTRGRSLIGVALAGLLALGDATSAAPTQCPGGCTGGTDSAVAPRIARALPWSTADEAHKYRVAVAQTVWTCQSGRQVVGTEYQKDGQGYYLAASRGRWVLWEYNDEGSESLYIWYGQRTKGDGGGARGA